MTITVNTTQEIVSINNTSIPATFDFVLTSGFSREPQDTCRNTIRTKW